MWDALSDWLDKPTGLRVTTVEVTRWNVISTAVAVILSAIYAFGYVGSVRLFLLLVGGYALGGLVMFMVRENRGEG